VLPPPTTTQRLQASMAQFGHLTSPPAERPSPPPSSLRQRTTSGTGAAGVGSSSSSLPQIPGTNSGSGEGALASSSVDAGPSVGTVGKGPAAAVGPQAAFDSSIAVGMGSMGSMLSGPTQTQRPGPRLRDGGAKPIWYGTTRALRARLTMLVVEALVVGKTEEFPASQLLFSDGD
jgi:hypothetical protein